MMSTTIPSNYGYIINDKRVRVCDHPTADPIDNKEVFVDPDTREIHTWKRYSYSRWILADPESVEKAFTVENSILNGRTYITSHKMEPCPKELVGECSQNCSRVVKHDHMHFYHYASGEYKDGKPVCKYPVNRCWERMNARHCTIFVHNE